MQAQEIQNPLVLDPSDKVSNYLKCLENKGIGLLSAHRGGFKEGFPENALESMQAAVAYGPMLLEVDVRESADGNLILFHDTKLDQKTNGKGKVSDFSLAELKKLRLKDPNGNLTNFSIPTLQEVLSWARNRAIVQLDVKRGTDYAKVAQAVVNANAVDSVILIAYDKENALTALNVNSDFSFSMSINKISELQELESSGIPTEQVVAWTGVITEPEDNLWLMLDELNILTAAGAFWDFETKIIQSGHTKAYSALIDAGVDIIGVDHYQKAYDAISSRQNLTKAMFECK